MGHSNDFGGINTAGAHSNEDSQSSEGAVASLSFGARDALQIGGTPFSPELELQLSAEHDVVSASFPGLPTPTFFYNSSIRSQRLGANFWAPLGAGNTWSLEGGFGLGAQRTDLETNDTVVESDSSDVTAFGMAGLRASRPTGGNGRLTFDLRYLFAGETSHPLTSMVGGAPAGELTHRASGFQVGIGYQIDLGP